MKSDKFIFFLPVFLSFYAISSPPGVMGRINAGEYSPEYMAGAYVSKDTYGLRANATASAIMANSPTPFSFPIIGLDYTKALSSYRDRDSVGLYVGNESRGYDNWESISHGKFTPTSFYSSEVDGKKIKAGMIIETTGKDKWTGIVFGVSSGKVLTNGWVNLKSGRFGTPSGNEGVIINPITKIWATNFNIVIDSNGRASKGVVQENGVINNKEKNPSSIYGTDNVLLPQSKYGGTISYLSRSASSGNKQQWSIGFMSRSASNANFSSSDGTPGARTIFGFDENSSADNGMRFNGKNKSSSLIWTRDGQVMARISPTGQIEKISYSTKKVSNGEALTFKNYRYLVDSSGNIKLTLPPAKKEQDGTTMEIVNLTHANIAFNSSSQLQDYHGEHYDIKAIVYNGSWIIY